jgi:hypothetical protein
MVSRLIRLAAFVLAMVPVLGFAFPATDTTPEGACTSAPCTEYATRTWGVNNSTATGWFSSKAGACEGYRASWPINGWAPYAILQTEPTCIIGDKNGSPGPAGTYATRSGSPVTPTYSCPANSTVQGDQCVCSTNFVESGNSCVNAAEKKCSDISGGSDLFTGYSQTPTIDASYCPSEGPGSSCGAKITGAFATQKNGVLSWTYDVTYDGSTCTPPPPDTTAENCNGTVGTVNGQTVCVTGGQQTGCRGTVGTVNGVSTCVELSDRNLIESIKSTSKTNPVPSGSQIGSLGGTTTTEHTKCAGGQCSTTTTTKTTPADGGAPTVTEETTQQAKDDYCKENPRAVSCKETVFNDIEAEPVAQNNIALSIDKAASFGPENSTCPAPKTVTVLGVSLSMPFTLLCDFAEKIRPLLIGFAYLSAAMTFFGFAKK